MPKPKKAEIQEEGQQAVEELNDREKLTARREHLLQLFKLIQDERVPVPSQLEVQLSYVNEELIKLGE